MDTSLPKSVTPACSLDKGGNGENWAEKESMKQMEDSAWLRNLLFGKGQGWMQQFYENQTVWQNTGGRWKLVNTFVSL